MWIGLVHSRLAEEELAEPCDSILAFPSRNPNGAKEGRSWEDAVHRVNPYRNECMDRAIWKNNVTGGFAQSDSRRGKMMCPERQHEMTIATDHPLPR